MTRNERLKAIQLITRTVLIMLVAVSMASTLHGQDVRVEVGKRTTSIPKNCESLVPAAIAPNIDISSLLKEAICKGSGDMLSEYSYEMRSAKRTVDKKGSIKESSTTYEVYMPTLKSGTRGRGILLVTHRNDLPVPEAELKRERERAGERLEKEEIKVDRQPTQTLDLQRVQTPGLVPVGMYPRSRITRNSFGVSRADAAVIMQTFLEKCELSFEGRETLNGRTSLVFRFVPRDSSQFNDNEKYIATLTGKIWIDETDRIVSRLAGWPTEPAKSTIKNSVYLSETRPPALYVEMVRLPEGVWLSKVVRLNGADYRNLFDGVNEDVTISYREYKRFTTETKDVYLNSPTSTK